MKNTDNKIRAVSTLKQYLKSAESDIKELTKRKDKLNAEIQKVQDDILDLSEDEVQEKIGALTSTREATEGALADRRQRIETLQEELPQAEKIEADRERFQELVKLAKEA